MNMVADSRHPSALEQTKLPAAINQLLRHMAAWVPQTVLMDHFPRYVTHMRKFGYYSINPAWGGNSCKLMYCVYGEIRLIYYSSACSSDLVATTCERLTQLIVWRMCFLLVFVALPYDFPWMSYASTKFTRLFQNDLPPSPWRFFVSTKVRLLLFESGECRLRWSRACNW